nr:nucleoside triphosphate pyrophosphohydrolase family protein [uncultured Alistipes sp.]
MELNEYQKQAMTTCTESSNNFSYMILNLAGEVGELASKVAKMIRKEEVTITQNDLCGDGTFAELCTQEDEMQKEAGDILWQLAGLCSVMGWQLEDVARSNLEKLASRKERGVIVGDGDNR